MTSKRVEPFLGRPGKSSWRQHLLCILAVLAALEIFQQLHGDWFRWRATVRYNPQFQEAWAWWHGRLDLRYLLWDTAQLPEQGKVYSVYPRCNRSLHFSEAILGQEHAGIPTGSIYFFALPLPFVGYRIFLRARIACLAALLTLG
jgi:hypothetical protein